MKIVTDSAANMTKEEILAHNITVLPLYIHFPGEEVSSEAITADEFYDRLKAMAPNIPTTSQPSSGQFAEAYRKLAQEDTDILSIHISSGLSGTIESARAGVDQAPEAKVEIWDSLTLSGGERFQVLAAAQGVKASWSKAAILERIKKIQDRTELIYMLETLEYLARGGRIGRVQALAGSLLKLKPIIKVDHSDGKYSTVGKERTTQKALMVLVDYLAGVYGNQEPLWITVLHGQFAEQADNLVKMARERLNVARLEVLRVSPVLGVHTGPQIVGIGALPISLMEGID